MRDFTLLMYTDLCQSFEKQGYKFITFSDFCANNDYEKFVIMRHDVDRSSKRAKQMARLENEMNFRSSYYFRFRNGHCDENIIKEIAALGHEIGYHYEDLSLAKGDYNQAIAAFRNNLNRLRDIYPVKTICMHGNPLSKWDNREIWQNYCYQDFDIIGEPYFELDFNKVLYLTDTGRRWDGEKVSIRDKVASKYQYKFRTTFDIIKELSDDNFPDKLMINIHPQRWIDKPLPWLKEIVWQNAKNVIKHIIVR